MHDPLDFNKRPVVDALKRKRLWTWFVLLLENITQHGWRLLSWTLFFGGLWLFQVPMVFGSVASILTVVVFFAGLGYFLYHDIRRVSLPGHDAISKRIERESGVKHRPLTALEDTLVNPRRQKTRELWEQQKEKIFSVLPGLRPGHTKPLLAAKDPQAFRLGAVLFFALGILIAGPSWQARLSDGLFPFEFKDGVKPFANIHVWITPPEYTKLEKLVLTENDTGSKLNIPMGSTLKITMRSGLVQPDIVIDETAYPMQDAGDGNYMLEMAVPEGTRFAIRQFFITCASWDYSLVPDEAPRISQKLEPAALPDGPIRFPLTVYDDYSVKDLTMTMTLDPVIEQAPLGHAVTETRSVISPAKTDFDLQPVYDLTWHSWAGLPVIFTFAVTDHVNQTTLMEPIKMVLPERVFRHPVAKKLIAMRKQLAWAPLEGYQPMTRELETLLTRPSAFQDDWIVFLAIRSAASRLFWSTPTEEMAKSVMALLWDTALRIEDGDLTLAARNLHDAQQELEEALDNPEITDQELAAVMHELREAMAEYMQALQEELQKKLAEGDEIPMLPPEMLENMANPEALADFLDQMESMLRDGDKEGAQEMLSQLQRMMDMMDPSMMGSMPPDMQMMGEGINELQELIERQEELLEQTEKQAGIVKAYEDFLANQSEKDLDIPELSINTQVNKAEQEALRLILGQLMLEAGEALDEIPEAMGLAEQEMRGSSEQLGDNKPILSVPHQEKALEYLKEAQDSLSEQLMARMQQMTGMSFGQMPNGGGYDPLGRRYGEDQNGQGFPGARVKIPDAAERKRAQEILKLLRRRAGEHDRPDVELDYYRRLLKQF